MRDLTEDGATGVGVEASVVFEPCASCGAGCCRCCVVSVTGFDIKRLLKRIGGKPEDFLEARRATEVSFSFEQPFFLMDGKKQGDAIVEWLVCLKRMKDRGCVFQNKKGRCVVHDIAPLSCRAYPFTISDERLVFVENAECPRKWKEEEIKRGSFQEVVGKMFNELRENGMMVRRWNAKIARQRNASFEKFVSYLIRQIRLRRNASEEI